VPSQADLSASKQELELREQVARKKEIAFYKIKVKKSILSFKEQNL
jgi:hypothetical protein